MARQYVCTICGRSVATFQSWKDVEPSDVVDIMESELRSHNVNTADMDATGVLSRFRIVDAEGVSGPNAGEADKTGTWAGQ